MLTHEEVRKCVIEAYHSDGIRVSDLVQWTKDNIDWMHKANGYWDEAMAYKMEHTWKMEASLQEA